LRANLHDSACFVGICVSAAPIVTVIIAVVPSSLCHLGDVFVSKLITKDPSGDDPIFTATMAEDDFAQEAIYEKTYVLM
jgi:hypothetical protein